MTNMSPIEEKRKNFVLEILNLFISVPKCICYVRHLVNSESNHNAEILHYMDHGSTFKELHMSSRCFEYGFERCLGIIAHEAMHLALTDVLTTLEADETINREVYNLITERSAYSCAEIVEYILKHEKQMRKEFNKVKVKENQV